MLLPLICRSFSVRHDGCSCSFNACWHHKRTHAKNCQNKDACWWWYNFLSERRLNFYCIWIRRWPISQDSKILPDMRGCLQLLTGTCQSVWFETAVVSYWRTSFPSEKMILKLFVFYGQECFLISLLINFGSILRILAPKLGGGGGGG